MEFPVDLDILSEDTTTTCCKCQRLPKSCRHKCKGKGKHRHRTRRSKCCCRKVKSCCKQCKHTSGGKKAKRNCFRACCRSEGYVCCSTTTSTTTTTGCVCENLSEPTFTVTVTGIIGNPGYEGPCEFLNRTWHGFVWWGDTPPFCMDGVGCVCQSETEYYDGPEEWVDPDLNAYIVVCVLNNGTTRINFLLDYHPEFGAILDHTCVTEQEVKEATLTWQSDGSGFCNSQSAVITIL